MWLGDLKRIARYEMLEHVFGMSFSCDYDTYIPMTVPQAHECKDRAFERAVEKRKFL